jgi:hypothetical protein
MSTAPGPATPPGWRASACAGSGCARRRVHQGLLQDHHLGARHLSVAHPRLALPGRGNCPEGLRGRSRRGHEIADRCGGPQGGARHLAACREHPNGLLGHPGRQAGPSAGRGQHQNLAAGHRCHPGHQGATSARRTPGDRFAAPSGDCRERVGDLARASPPAGLGHRPVRRARHLSERTARYQDRMGVGPGPIASWGRLRDRPARGAQEVGSVCRSSARGGHGSLGAAGSACRSSGTQLHRGPAGLALGPPLTAGLAAPALVARRRLPLLAAR